MEDILKIYREELARVQAERDAAQVEARKLWAAVGLLKGAAGGLLGTVLNVKECADNDEFLRPDGLQLVIDGAVADIETAEKITGMISV